MPFGKYADFEMCVRENKDKRKPAAYCAVIMRSIEGKHKKRKR